MRNLKYLFIGILTLWVGTMSAQSAALNVALKFQIGNPGSTGTNPTFTMSGFVSDDLGRWDATNVQVGDSLYAINGSDLAVCVVTTINSAAGNSLNITVTCGDPLVGGIDAGQAAIIHPTSEYKFPTYISGLRDDLRSMIMNRLTQRIDEGVRNAQEVAFTSGTGVPNSTVATIQGYRLAKNSMGDGDLYEWNGTTWAISGGSGSSFQPCVDTIIITGIIPAPVLGSGMVRVSGGWDNISGFVNTKSPDGVVISITGSTAVIATCGSYTTSLSAGNYYADSVSTNGFTTTTPTGNIRPLGHVTEGAFTVSSLGTVFQSASGSGISSVSVTARLSGNGTSGSPLDIAQQSATSGQVLSWNGTAWAPATVSLSNITRNIGTVPAGITTAYNTYGFCPTYSNSSSVFASANTTLATTLHQFYITNISGSTVTIKGSGEALLTSTFAYTAGETYYIQDDGTLAITGDSDGDAIDYLSPCLYVIASLGSNNYIVNFYSPIHTAVN